MAFNNEKWLIAYSHAQAVQTVGSTAANEVIEQALRRSVPMFPELAVRELVANALIHQDLFVTGAGPMVEINEMDKADRVRACYLHACLKWVMRDYLTNASLRARFGVEEKNKAAVSRYIREAVEDGAIKPFDEGASRKLMKYVPFWAKV